MHRNRWVVFVQSAFGGVLAGSFIGGSQPLFVALGIAFLWSSSQFYWAGGVWGGFFVLVSHRWLLALHPLTWIGIPSLFSLLITISLWLFCGFIGFLLVGIWSWVASFGYSYLKVGNCLSRNFFYAIFLSSLWGYVEVLLAQSPFFWTGIGASLLPGDRALAGLARWFGSGGLAAVQLLIGWWLWQLFVKLKKNEKARELFVKGLFVLALAHSIGFFLLIHQTPNGQEKLALWQSNIPIREKFSKEQLDILPEKVNFILGKAQSLGASILIAPEGTLPANFKLISSSNVKFISGGFRWEDGGQRNSLMIFDSGHLSPSSFLDKFRLVPLGERIPPVLSIFSHEGLSAVGGLSPGKSSRLMQWQGPSFAAAICYEISDGELVSKAVKNGAKWVLSIANLDPYPLLLQRQFLSLLQVRSIETSRDVVSVANTGPTTIIRSTGKIQSLFNPNKDIVDVVHLNLYQIKTPYVLFGKNTLLVIPLISFIASIYFKK